MPSPLDEMFPGWRADSARVSGPIHHRVLEEPLGDGKVAGEVAFVLIVWKDPGGAAALHAAMRSAIESTLLAELSRPPADLALEGARRPVALRVLMYEPLEGAADALRAFGLRARDKSGLAECFAHVRGEANGLVFEGLDDTFEVDEPDSVWEARFHIAAPPELEDALRGRLGDRVFGSEPGALFAALNECLRAASQDALKPRAQSLDILEKLLVADEEDVVRWIPSALFQALCDAVSVCAAKDLGRTIQWASSEKDDDGLAPAPMIRLQDGNGWAHVPLARDLMRWCIMPKQAGEVVPPLSTWLHDRF